MHCTRYKCIWELITYWLTGIVLGTKSPKNNKYNPGFWKIYDLKSIKTHKQISKIETPGWIMS